MAGVQVTTGEFNDMRCLWLANDHVRLAVTTDRGPRIVSWGWREGPNLFAELPDASAETPFGTLHFIGGHRLWYAPETRETTYWPDNDPVSVEELDGGASFTAPADNTGIVKRIAVRVSPDGPEVRVTHMLRNTGSRAVELAPWAISMCRTGGVALLPQPQEPTDSEGFLPNRSFSFWPYSDLNDSRIAWGNRVVLVRATPRSRNKIGYRNVHGWFAYWLEGTLFTKQFDAALQGAHPVPADYLNYPDLGCNAEFYFAEDFIELETLGRLVRLESGGEISHEEVWRLQAEAGPIETEDAAYLLAQRLNLL